MYCGICIEECPFDALEWTEGPTAAGESLLEEMRAPRTP
jgi:NADH-quinone oxidoreductase subunit I